MADEDFFAAASTAIFHEAPAFRPSLLRANARHQPLANPARRRPDLRISCFSHADPAQRGIDEQAVRGQPSLTLRRSR